MRHQQETAVHKRALLWTSRYNAFVLIRYPHVQPSDASNNEARLWDMVPQVWVWRVSSAITPSQEMPQSLPCADLHPRANRLPSHRLQVASCLAHRNTTYPENIFCFPELSKLLTLSVALTGLVQ